MDISNLTVVELAGLDAMAARASLPAQGLADAQEADALASISAQAREAQLAAWRITAELDAPEPEPEPLTPDQVARVQVIARGAFEAWARALLSPFALSEALGESPADRASRLVLRASAFWISLSRLLIERGAIGPTDDARAFVVARIDAAAGAMIDADTALSARVRVMTAVEFHRNDPESPGLMDAVGALLGLTPGEIDDVFLAAVGQAHWRAESG